MVSPEDRARIERENRHRTWVESNPLRLWRRRQEISQAELAPLLGYSVNSIGAWERYPFALSAGALAALAGLMRLAPEEVTASWSAWITSRPEMAGGECAS